MESLLEKRLSQIDQWIKEGKLKKARIEVSKLSKQKIEKEERLRICSFANRLNLPNISLLILNRVVRPEGRIDREPTPEEKLEYSAALTMIGAYRESESILGELDAAKYPKALLYLAFNYINQWDYNSSLPLLQAYVRSPQLSDYEKLIGMVNWVSALVHEERVEARELLVSLMVRTKEQYPRLYLNMLIRSVEFAFLTKSWDDGKKYINEAKLNFESLSGLESLFLRKWELFLRFSERKQPSAIVELSALREEARKLKHWETIRSVDFFQAVLFDDHKLLMHVYVGTPNKHYRDHMASQKSIGEMPTEYERELSPGATTIVAPLQSNVLTRGFKLGQSLSRLLSVLCSDFYRPLRIAEVSSELFPEETYNPSTTPHRVEQLVGRLRKQLQKADYPIAIYRKLGLYQVVATKPCVLRMPTAFASRNRNDILLDRLAGAFGEKDFKTPDAAKKLGLDRWTTLRVLNHGLSRGRLQSQKGGRSRRYSFLTAPPISLKDSA